MAGVEIGDAQARREVDRLAIDGAAAETVEDVERVEQGIERLGALSVPFSPRRSRRRA